jgi:DNA-binding NarL/FixJ family response regulator
MSSTFAPSRSVRIAVANDYDLVVAGVASLLSRFSPGLEVTELVVGRDGLSQPVDVVLFDTYGRAEMGLERVRQLQRMPKVGKVAVYTLSWDTDLVRAALDNGADAVLSKTLPASQLAADLAKVARGEAVVDPGTGRQVRSAERVWPGRDRHLTERESEVLALVAVGATNAQIGARLLVAESTVKTHVKHILQKLGVTNRAQAVSQYLAV